MRSNLAKGHRLRRALVSIASLSLVALCVTPATSAHADSGLVVDVPLGGDVVSAVVAVGESGGGTVVLASGTYTLSGVIPIFSNTTLEGQGPSTILQAPPTSPGGLIEAAIPTSTANVNIENLTLDGNVHRNTYLNSGGQDNPYSSAAIYMYVDGGASIYFVNISGVTVRNDGEALQMGGITGLTLDNDNFYDNNPGGNFAHDVYLVSCADVSINNSYFDDSGADGLHMDFTALGGDTITHSDFSHDTGYGILMQGNAGELGGSVNVSDNSTSFDGDDGIQEDSDNALFGSDVGSYDGGYALNNVGGFGLADGLYGFGDGAGFPPYYFQSPFNLVDFYNPNAAPNTYPAVEAPTGVVGPNPTADWTTADGGGQSGLGLIDFTGYAHGSLSFSQVGATTAGTYAASLSYANPNASAVSMALEVNGVSDGDVSFAPTGSVLSESSVSLDLPLVAGNNVVTLSALPSGTPVLDTLYVDAPIPPTPSEPTGVTAVASGPYQVDLSWNPVPGAQSYIVSRGGVTIATGVTATSYSDQSIPFSGATESYTVTAVNQGGGSSPSASVSATTPPDAPQIVNYSSSPTANSIRWFTVNGASLYFIERSTTEGGPYTAIGAVPNTTSISSSNFEQSFTDTSLTPGVTYYYVVVAANAGVFSAPSAEVGSALTPVYATPDDGEVTLSWAGPQSASTVTASPGGETCTTTSLTACTVTGLTDGQTYDFTIDAGGSTAQVSATPYPSSVMNASDGLSLWLDGTDPSTLFTSPSCTGTLARAGQGVGCWADKSGSGENFSQTSVADKPTVSTIGAKGALTFGTEATSTGTSLTSTDAQGTYQTVFVVVDPQSKSNGTDDLFMEQGDSVGVRLDPSGTLADPTSSDWSYGTGTPTQEYTDGTQAVEPPLASPVIIAVQSATPKTIAATLSDATGGSGLVGSIGEVVAFKGVLSVSERATVTSYLAHKWGITLGSVVAPPTTTISTTTTSTTTIPVTGSAAGATSTSSATTSTSQPAASSARTSPLTSSVAANAGVTARPRLVIASRSITITHVGSLRATSVPVTLHCVAATCQGTVKIVETVVTKRSTTTKSTSSRRSRGGSRTRTIVLAHASYRLVAGTTRVIRLHTTTAGAAVLGRVEPRRPLTATVDVTVHGSSAVTRRLILR